MAQERFQTQGLGKETGVCVDTPIEMGKQMKRWLLQTGSGEESKVNKRVLGWEDEDIASRGINQLTYQRVSQAKGLNARISPENLCLFHGNSR